jgi:cytosine deaminase
MKARSNRKADMSALSSLPENATIHLRRAHVPATLIQGDFSQDQIDREGLALVDLQIKDGVIAEISAAQDQAGADSIDLDGGQVWPAFVDIHTHLDKGHILPRAMNPDGTVYGAVRSVAADREKNWSAADVRRRFEFGLRCAYAHGTAAIRTHIDSDPPQAETSWPVFAEMREQWAGKMDLQAVGKLPLEMYLTKAGEHFAEMVAEHKGLLGGVTNAVLALTGQAAILDEALNALFRLAARFDLQVDLHVDESGDPAATTLSQVARATIRHQFQGRVVCDHCCSLANQFPDVVRETIELCAEAGLAVVTLPLINQYLQSRSPGQTPTWRGVTLIHELAARGIPVAIASDNCRDPFFAYGDHDMLEVYNQAVRIAHLDLPYHPWPRSVTSLPADLMKLPARGRLAPGLPADLVLFRARTMSELLSRPQADRLVLRAGRPIDTTLPDYRELDDLFSTH